MLSIELRDHMEKLSTYHNEACHVIKTMSNLISLQTRRYYLTKEVDRANGVDAINAESEIVWDNAEARLAYERCQELLELIKKKHFGEESHPT